MKRTMDEIVKETERLLQEKTSALGYYHTEKEEREERDIARDSNLFRNVW
jgi:hypothetical protein